MNLFLSKKYIRILIIVLFISNSIFAGKYDKVDQHVQNTPSFTDKDLLHLTQYLVNPFDKQEEKVRAIYRWITTNIEYDIVAYRARQQSDLKPEDILRDRKCVCGGYANLFKSMVELAGMEAEFITGYSKGYNYQIGKVFDDNNMHAWNAVKLDGRWNLLDATWGAGYINDDMQFVPAPNDYYFLSPPEQFIESHYPSDFTWQLLDRKVSRREFEESAYLRPAFFAYSLETVSHNKYQIQTDWSLQVILKGPKNIDIIAQLLHGDVKQDKELTFVQRNGERFEVNATFPYTASYILRIFAKNNSDPNYYKWVMDYQVKAQAKGHRALGFPEKFAAFDEHQAYLYSPLDRLLKVGKQVNIKIRLTRAERVAMICNDKFTFLKKSGDYFEGEYLVQPGDQFLTAKIPGSNQFHYLLRYIGW